MLNVLLVIADPLTEELAPVTATEEWQAIAQAVGGQLAPVTFYRLLPATWKRLRQSLLGRLGPFHVVHFIGHGDTDGLVLEDEFGRVDYVQANDLADALAERDVQLVVLNVCESESPGGVLVRRGVPAVVATTRSISNRQAVTLAQELYGALAAGRSLKQAMAQVAMALNRDEGVKAANLPVLIGDPNVRFSLPELTESLPRYKTLGMPKHNLPYVGGFRGRFQELQIGLDLLSAADVRAVQVTGLGGIGKTAFAIQLAHRSAWRFFGGVVWVGSNVSRTPFSSYLIRQAERVLGNSPGDVDAVIEEAECRPVLFVFDDVDVMEDECKQEFVQFLERLPLSSGSKIALLTRTHFDLDVDGIATIRLRGMEAQPAREYLLHQAMLQDAGELAVAPAHTLSEIAERLGHHPKMMQFAVGWIKALGLEEGWERISRLPQPLAEKLDLLLAQSVAMLKPADVAVLRAIGTFVGPFRAQWLAEINGDQSLDSFQNLVDSNLLDPSSMVGCHELHPIVRDYIAATIPPDAVHLKQHARFFAQRVSLLAHRLFKMHDSSTIHEFDVLVDEAYQAVLRMHSSEDPESKNLVSGLVRGLREYLHFYRRDWAAIESLEAIAVTTFRDLADDAQLGAALTSYGAAVAALGDLEEGLARCLEGLDRLAVSGERRAQSVGYGALGFIHRLSGSRELAERAYQQGLAFAQDLADLDLEIRHLSNLGTLRRMAKDGEGAWRLHQQALELASQTDNQMSIAILLDQLGLDARHSEALDDSVRYHERAMRLKASLGDRVGLRISRNSLASTLKQLGRPGDAIPLLEDSLMELGDTNELLEWWLVLLQLGRMYRTLEVWETARGYYEQALEMAEAASYLRGVSMCERGIGLCFKQEGSVTAARAHLTRAVEISNQTNDPFLSTLLAELKQVEVT